MKKDLTRARFRETGKSRTNAKKWMDALIQAKRHKKLQDAEKVAQTIIDSGLHVSIIEITRGTIERI